MTEKVNPSHPDKIADRIAGAVVDLAYQTRENPKIAVEVLVGHGKCHLIAETDADLDCDKVAEIIKRLAGDVYPDIDIVPQDKKLAENQAEKFRCGDNGIFRGVPLTEEDKRLSLIARSIYARYPFDGKYILDESRLIICQSNARTEDLRNMVNGTYPNAIINPLGEWTGGTNVDTGAVNRKLGSDMSASVTGGGPHGKDLSKADVSATIHAFLKAQKTGKVVEFSCAIGDAEIDGLPYEDVVKEAKEYIDSAGGFEKFAEWGFY